MTATVLHAQQLGNTLIEFVVADAGHVQAHGIERFDRRLVVEQPGEGRRTADQVSGGDSQRMLVPHPQLTELGRKVLGSAGRITIDGPGRLRGHVTVIVVECEQLQLDESAIRVGMQVFPGVGSHRSGRGGGQSRHQRRHGGQSTQPVSGSSATRNLGFFSGHLRSPAK